MTKSDLRILRDLAKLPVYKGGIDYGFLHPYYKPTRLLLDPLIKAMYLRVFKPQENLLRVLDAVYADGVHTLVIKKNTEVGSKTGILVTYYLARSSNPNSHEFEIPDSIIDADDPQRAATIWRLETTIKQTQELLDDVERKRVQYQSTLILAQAELEEFLTIMVGEENGRTDVA